MYQNQEYKNRFRILKGGLISLVVASNLYSAPSGGTVVNGNVTINQNGNTTNINQSSQKASINWQDFSISKNETVNFNQPNQNSITLNRVVGTEKSVIDGALNANGQVWLLNSNGTLFGKNAKVNTSGLLVTTKELSDKDFQNGNYNFKGDSKATIENSGFIDSKKYASFVANAVINNGTIKVYSGTINLTGASEFSISLDENSNISLKVTKGVLDALVENNNLIIANGGNVYLTTNAKNELLKGVVNNTGIIEAASLDDLQSEVILFANGGTANISGEIKAKNSFVETSGKDLNVTNEAKITAKKWLLDPVNVTIDNSNGTIGNEKVGATVIQNALNNNTDIEIQANNNINVNQAITWSTAQELTLNAGNNIYINKEITATNNSGKLALKYGQSSATGGSSDYYVNAKVNLKAGQNFSTQKGSNVANLKNYMVITDLGTQTSSNDGTLQGMKSDLGNTNANYVLGSDIDASFTSSWNSGAGFNPLGNYTTKFTGIFNGLGHTISDLYINRGSIECVGLFGYINNATIKNIGLENVNITGDDYTGSLVGYSEGGIISNSYATGTVRGINIVGGLVGTEFRSEGIIENSYSKVDVIAYYSGAGAVRAGGLAGMSIGNIKNSYASGTVTGTINDSYKSGLVIGGIISNSWYDKDVNTANMSDSVKGKTQAEILTAFSGKDGWITGAESFEGYGLGVTAPVLPELKTFSTITPTGTLFEGGYGTSTNPYTITNWTQLQNINNINILTRGYYFNLLNNLSNSTSDYTNLASSSANSSTGWNPIGNFSNKFIGTFDGQGNTISNLYINRHFLDVGLFGASDSVSTIRNIGLKDVNISGLSYVGALVGQNYGTILNSYASGDVNGYFNNNIGGLVGENSGTITNSYARVSAVSTSAFGGLVGANSGTISNSFYDITKFNGNGLGFGLQTGVTGLTTEQMSYGGIFKTAGWDIVADSTLAEGTPVIKFDSVNNKYVWAIAPKTFTANLGNQSVDYNGLLQNLSSIYTSQAIFGTTGVNFKFVDVDNNDITAYKNAGTYSNIGVVSLDEFIVAGVGTKGTLTINKANLDIVANSNSLVYNGQTQSVNGYSFGTNKLLGSDTVADLTLSGTTTSGKNAGIYNTNLGGSSYNYNINFTQGNLSISKANATVTVNDSSKVYNGQNQNFDFSVSGLLGSDTKSDLVGLTGLQSFSKNAGTYYSMATGTDTNYNLNFVQGELEITKADATVTANSMNKVYNGQTQNLSGYSVIGLVGNDRMSSLTGIAGDSVSGKNAGTYNTNLSGTDTNYNLIFVNGKLTINKANLTVSADNKSKIEGEINPSLTYVANGLIGNDTLNGSLSTTATITSQAGNYDIEKGSLSNSNYNIDFIKGTLSVEAKPIPIPEPQPIIDKNIEKVVASVDRIVNTNLPKNQEFMPNSNNQINSSTQTTPDISNPNVKVISFNEGRNVQVIGDGVKMPVNNVQDNIKQLFVQNEEIK
ncbi:beta strand repeat-containing protein [Aliarcobacter butzleri]|uniref:beta strand repeat-containing protein n=1 Tax=Aliarcobacter butzleri TaxID=28197 RepID=UPI002B24DFC7|nr:MBG domain-containing protein [Aliarcobacter butzleri]